jgi:predicted secreted protein
LSAGYSWHITQIAGTSLTQRSVQHVSHSDELFAQPGTPGTFVAQFKATSSGRTTVSIVYRRPGGAVVRKFSVTIDVTP